MRVMLVINLFKLKTPKLRALPLPLPSNFSPTRPLSQSTSIPKKLQRVRDHGYDNYMEIEKKTRRVLKFQDLILSQRNQTLPISRMDLLARRLGFQQHQSGSFVLKFPHIFDIYEHPVQRILYIRLTRKALLQIEQEKQALKAQIPDAVTRLRKLVMMSNTGRVRLEHVRVARKEFGLPDDFECSVILKHPQYFRLFNAGETRNKYIEIVERAESLAVCAIEKLREREYREKGSDAEDIRFSFIVNFPPGFKIGKYYRIAVWKWQRVPYWSPYEDVSGYDLRSLEAQKRMEKRAVATIHELLSLTVEKKITLERIAHFRLAMNLPKRLKEFLLQHQGIFYISTRGNQGKLHTVFLREAYRRGELIEPNDLYLARRKLADLVLLSPRKASLDISTAALSPVHGTYHPLFLFLSMALPQHQFQQHYQPQQHQQQQSKSFRNLYAIDGQIQQPVAYYNPTNLQDQSQHPPYIPSFHVVGFAPGPVAANDGSDIGADLQWNYGVEPKKKRVKEQDFLENNSQISSVDFLQPRSVSTGLGLSLDNTRMASTGDSALLSLIGDEIECELQRQDAEIDRFLKVQGDRLRQNILEKVQATQVQTLSFVEEKVLQKLREKEAEVEIINRKNVELEERMEELTVEAGAWQQRARHNENMITALKFNLQQVYAQSKDSKEGCGDSEVDDTASCCNGRSIDFHLLRRENNDMKEVMTCKACRINEVCMLLLPCRHLCLCKDCESKLSFCPLCQSSKLLGVEVYL